MSLWWLGIKYVFDPGGGGGEAGALYSPRPASAPLGVHKTSQEHHSAHIFNTVIILVNKLINITIDNVLVAVVVNLISVGIVIRIIIVKILSIAMVVSVVTSVAWNIDVIMITLIAPLPC